MPRGSNRVVQGEWHHPVCPKCDPDVNTRTYVDDDQTVRWNIRSRVCDGEGLVDFHAGLQILHKVLGWRDVIRASTGHSNLHLRHYHHLSGGVVHTTPVATIDCQQDMMSARNWTLAQVIPQTERWLREWHARSR